MASHEMSWFLASAKDLNSFNIVNVTTSMGPVDDVKCLPDYPYLLLLKFFLLLKKMIHQNFILY